MSQGDFSPPVKGGYQSDGAYHRRNWKALANYLRSTFITSSQIADGAIGEAQIQDLSVTNAKIASLAVDKLTSGQLTADVIVGSRIATADSGQRVVIDTNGIRLTDGTSDTVNISVSGDASFSGVITASSLTSSLSTLGGNTTIDSGGWVRFSSGIADPSAAPAVAFVYDTVSLSGGGSATRGIEWDAANNQFLSCYPNGHRVYGWLSTGGAEQWSWVMTHGGTNCKVFGVTKMGTHIYIIGEKEGTTTIVLQELSLSSGTPIAVNESLTQAEGGAFDHFAGLTNDGTDIYFCWQNTSGDVKLNRYTTSPLAFAASSTLDTGFGADVYDITHENTAGCRWWICVDATVTFNILAYDSTPSAVSAENFNLPAASRGVCWDGSKFLTTPNAGGYWREHTGWRSSSNYVHTKYAWYNNGSAYESKPSADMLKVNPKRAKARVTWPSFPTGVDRARVYMLENGSSASPAAGTMKRQGTETGPISQTYSSYASGGAADATSSSFPSSTPSRLTLPKQSSAPSSPETGEIYYDTGTNKAYVYNGATWNALF